MVSSALSEQFHTSYAKLDLNTDLIIQRIANLMTHNPHVGNNKPTKSPTHEGSTP